MYWQQFLKNHIDILVAAEYQGEVFENMRPFLIEDEKVISKFSTSFFISSGSYVDHIFRFCLISIICLEENI